MNGKYVIMLLVISEPWTISDMVEVTEQVDSRAISDKPANRRGVMKKY